MYAIILLLAFLFASPAWGAVAFDGSCTFSQPTAGTTQDVSYTVGAGNYLVAIIGIDNDTITSTSATWNQGGTNQAMTAVADNAGTGVVYGKAYGLANPTIGTFNLRFVNSSSVTSSVSICSFTGVDTASPLGTVVELESTGTATGSSLPFTLNSGGLALAFLIAQSAFTTFAQGAAQTQLDNTVPGCGSDCQAVTTWATVSPMDYTWASSGIDFWHVVLPINAAVAAARRFSSSLQ